jgi:hypothetical protein
MYQRRPSALTASEAWWRGLAAGSPVRARWQAGALEFHWGKPPPAAAPSTTTRINACSTAWEGGAARHAAGDASSHFFSAQT